MCKKCHRTAETGTSLCNQHQNADKQREHEREQKRQSGIRPLYWSKRWKVTRRHVIANNPQCAFVDSNTGARCPQLSTDVHHKIDAQVWMDQGGDFYDTDNLEALCHPHHSSETARTQGFAQSRGME
jgi:hypothetical protein